ncbi:MAG: hypothetical protein U1E29_08880, partial [Coriobacteriia bacterium]|nr:hypothetical protein [Coriobacteriia bacterium]
GEATGAALYAYVRDAAPETAEVLTGTLVGAEDVSEPEFVAAQTETRLKEFAVERLIIEKKAHMRSLDPLKDRDGYDELFREIAALQVRHEKLRSGEVDHDDREVWG